MKRLPNWLKIVLAAFGVLFVLGAVFGKAPDPQLTAAAPSSTPPTSTSSAAPTPAPVAVTYTVATVTDGATLVLDGSDGTRKTVRVLGAVAPAANTGCYWPESLAWANTRLYGAAVRLGAETARGTAVTLADGQDYAALAIQKGYLKYATDTAIPALAAAETTARQAATGLWGAPCRGTIDAPAPAPTTQAPPPAPAPVTKAAPAPQPAPTTEDAPAPEPDSAAYYKNCTAAKAAGAAPLHRGEPGYRPALDRDGDGVACER